MDTQDTQPQQASDKLSDKEQIQVTLQELFEEKEALTKDIFHLQHDLEGLLNALPSAKNRSEEEQAALDDTLEGMDFDGIMERLFLLINQIDAEKDTRQARIKALQAMNNDGDKRKASLEKVALSLLFATNRTRSGGIEAQRMVKKKPNSYKLVDEDKVPEEYLEPQPAKTKKAELVKAIKSGKVKPEDVGMEVSPGGLTLAKMPKRS